MKTKHKPMLQRASKTKVKMQDKAPLIHLACRDKQGFTKHLCEISDISELVLDQGEEGCCTNNLFISDCSICHSVYVDQVLAFLKDIFGFAKGDWEPKKRLATKKK